MAASAITNAFAPENTIVLSTCYFVLRLDEAAVLTEVV